PYCGPCVLASPLFFFHIPSPTDSYTLSLHDALPIFFLRERTVNPDVEQALRRIVAQKNEVAKLQMQIEQRLKEISRIFEDQQRLDRKSTRLNSSHGSISYAVFCLKKKIHITSAKSCT